MVNDNLIEPVELSETDSGRALSGESLQKSKYNESNSPMCQDRLRFCA